MSHPQVKLVKPKTQKGKRALQRREPQQVCLHVLRVRKILCNSSCVTSQVRFAVAGGALEKGTVSVWGENLSSRQGMLSVVAAQVRVTR